MYHRLDDGASLTATEALAAARLGDGAGDARPYTFFNFVSTLDGRAALDGSTRPLGGPADLEMLLSLRAAADAVLISRRFDIPWEAGGLAAVDQPVLVYTSRDAGSPPDVAAPVEIVELAECTPAAALADLRARGVRALLSEGGPTLFNGFMAAGLVDELFLTLSPLLTGDADELSILSGPRLAGPARFALRWVLRSEDELFLRYAAVR
jgi:riboflavin biosynthesis pyrimidine reductase